MPAKNRLTNEKSRIPNIALSLPSGFHWWVHFSISVQSYTFTLLVWSWSGCWQCQWAIRQSGRLQFCKKTELSRQGQLDSGDLPLVHTDGRTNVMIINKHSNSSCLKLHKAWGQALYQPRIRVRQLSASDNTDLPSATRVTPSYTCNIITQVHIIGSNMPTSPILIHLLRRKP